jgi:hypothetical protein
MTMNGSWLFQNAGLWQRGRRTSSARTSQAKPLIYQITDTTQLLLQQGDITLFEGDAIVNAGACVLRHCAGTAYSWPAQSLQHSVAETVLCSY